MGKDCKKHGSTGDYPNAEEKTVTNGGCACRPVPGFGSDGVTVRKPQILYCSTSYGQVVMPPNS